MKAYIVETDAIIHNLNTLKSLSGGIPIWAVLKGNGYGLGIKPMAELCLQEGIRRFAVTEISEALTIRELSADAQILMLRPTTDPTELHRILDLDVIATIGSTEDAAALNALAGQRSTVAEAHLKIDTGMGRYGFLPEETEKILSIYRYHDHLAISGIYTHFHSAFGKEKCTMAQAEAFRAAVKAIEDAGVEPGTPHLCNSSAFLRWPELKEGGIRIGSALLGRVLVKNRLRRVGRCEATVDELRWLPKGHSCGYSAGWVARRPTRIAVISVGWYHGFTAEHGNDLFRFRDNLRLLLTALKRILHRKRIYVHINGKKCPVLGHVGMLHTVCDVTNINCRLGDKVTLDINPTMVRGMDIQFQ